jgi:hypothetical protein
LRAVRRRPVSIRRKIWRGCASTSEIAADAAQYAAGDAEYAVLLPAIGCHGRFFEIFVVSFVSIKYGTIGTCHRRDDRSASAFIAKIQH